MARIGSPRTVGRYTPRMMVATMAVLGANAVQAGSEGLNNTYYGVAAGNNDVGLYNTALGAYAGSDGMTGSRNTFVGHVVGGSNIGGTDNSFAGAYAGSANTSGSYNTFSGSQAGYANTTAYYNSFFGAQAGRTNTSGGYNTYLGFQTGYANTTGGYNTFAGAQAGMANTTGTYNTFSGHRAGYSNTTGGHNTFSGQRSGFATTTGYYNSFFGTEAGANNTTGGYNTFLGRGAGFSSTVGAHNTFVGLVAGNSNTSGHRNSALGSAADVATGLNNATAIGFQSYVAQSNSLVLGSVPGANELNFGANSYVNVGIGATAPAAPLHVKRDVTGTGELALLENASATVANRVMLEMVNNGGAQVNFTHSGSGQTWALRAGVNGANVFDLYRVGGGILMRVNSVGNMVLKGTLTQNSNVHDKTGIVAVDAQALLGKVQRLPISTWSYKSDTDAVHLGPMAQDFHAAFGLGNDETRIAPADMAGVALAAIQAQQRQMAAQDERLARLEAENKALRAHLLALTAAMQTPARNDTMARR